MNNAGVIYILTNPSFPEYVKIGYADDLNKRLKDFNKSECIPYAFRVFAVYEVKERLQDIAIHNMIDNINPNLRAIETFDGKKRKKEFYAMTADDAYAILHTIAAISGTTERLHKMSPEGHEILDEKIAEEIESKIQYSEEAFISKADSAIASLYYKLKTSIENFGDVTVEPKKLYIAFKRGTNFADIEIQKHNMKIFINMKKGTLDDPDCLTDDVSEIGHWGNGDYRVYLNSEADLDYVIGLIKQSYTENAE